MTDEALLDLRFADLRLGVKGSAVEPRVRQLYRELGDRGIRFRPHVWVSSEWFTPDSVPGIAVPFYLVHPRLRALEHAQMLEVEGGTPDWCMRILRHEAGHAIDNAYRLRRRKRYRALFGDYHAPYPQWYRPKPYSRKYVIHLDMWYAQAHPAEDFAETFAVWLNPRREWWREYAGWPAMRKLLFVDQTLRAVGGKTPPVRNRRVSDPLHAMQTTLRAHYEQKREKRLRTHPRFYPHDLKRIFSPTPPSTRAIAAERFLQQHRVVLRMMVARWTGESQLTIDRTLADMIDTVRHQRLWLAKPPAETRTDLMMMLAVQTMNYLNDGHHRVSM